MISAALMGTVGLVAFGILRSSMILASQNAGINLSSLHGRQMIDQIGEESHYALEQPVIITKDGVAASGTAEDGILVKRYVGGPFVVKESGGTTGDIAATATSFVVEFNPEVPAPQVGDWILMESLSRPQLEITAVSTLANSGTQARRLITTATAIGEVAKPSSYRVTGSTYRKEAFAFAAYETTSNPRFELRYFRRVRSTTNYSTTSAYEVMAIGYRRLGSASFFTSSTSNSAPLITLRALVHSSGKNEYIERNKTASTFTTVPVQIRLWALTR